MACAIRPALVFLLQVVEEKNVKFKAVLQNSDVGA